MELILLWLIAGLMAAFTAWLLKEGSSMKTLNDATILFFLLSMMVTMFISTVVYFYYAGFTTLFVLVIFNMVTMSIFLIPVLMVLPSGDKPLEETLKGSPIPARTLVVASAIALVILSEVFMGWTFALAGGAVPAAGGFQAIYSAIVVASSSYWFIFTMASEMAITLFMMRKGLPGGIGWIVAAQVAVMCLSPTAVSNPDWANFSLLAGSLVMIFLFIYIFEFLYKNRTMSQGTLNYLVSLMLAYALMMAGLFVWLLDADASLFVLSLLVEMVVYFYIVFEEKKLSSPQVRGWHSMPFWVFAFLGLLFVAEFFMGGAIDIYAYGTSYFTSLPLASVGGPPLSALAAASCDLLKFFASITASPWYLIMMGVEMGALVLFKIKDARELETKIRLALVIVAYALYTVFLPVFVFSPSLPRIPWIGWSMGVGTAGALAPGVILALLATYLISGTLSFLFGSRNVCSLFCSAALMYQGTTIDSMSSFSRTSTLGRKFLTSRISSIYKVVVSVVWVSLLAGAVLSYLTSIGVLDFSIFGTDPSYFLYSFYFSFLWYVVWIMIPFVGTYACATTGMCGWGSFNHFASRLGFFKLKVMDGDVCWSCKTKDCAKVCPVGITDQPGSFIAIGELKSSKCIGVGDCVSACPYENIYFYDVRRWLREKLPGRSPVPMVSAGDKGGVPLSMTLKGESHDSRT
jgi:polyferredoxin